MNQAIFLDKDGTLIKDVPYNVNPEKITLESGVAEGLKTLQQTGYQLIIISNQPGVALGYFEEEKLDAVWEQIEKISGVRFDGFYYCPHFYHGTVKKYVRDCSCRKPEAGLILKAAGDLGIALDRSWMAGDILNDVEAGKRAGCKTILINNGNETEWVLSPERTPDFTVKSFAQLTELIVHHSNP